MGQSYFDQFVRSRLGNRVIRGNKRSFMVPLVQYPQAVSKTTNSELATARL